MKTKTVVFTVCLIGLVTFAVARQSPNQQGEKTNPHGSNVPYA